MTHANAPLTPLGRRRLAELVVLHGWSVRRAAERFQVSPATAAKWAARLRAGQPMTDQSSRPRSSPGRTPARVERRIINLRVTRRWGPHRISYHLGVPRSTVGRVLGRYRMPLLAHLDQATGLVVRRTVPVRYERARPGELVHMDIKKLGRIPDGGGHRMLGRAHGKRDRKRGVGYAYLHHVIDDHSRYAYSEILDNEQEQTVLAFWRRAIATFTTAGITIEAVMTDNGSAYRSKKLAAELDAADIRHLWTPPYRPQTNGKVERFNRTLVTEWAYAAIYLTDEARSATYTDWLHFYNHHRPHTGIGGQVPTDRVHNLTGNDS
jgi:transposase InsO family protein